MAYLSQRFFCQALSMLLLCIGMPSMDSHAQATSYACEGENLKVFTDSITSLLLAYQPIQVLHISDSLLQKYGHDNCPEVVRIKSGRANAYELLYNFEAALEIYNEIIKTAEKNQYIEDEVAIRLSLARVYETISRPELCLQNLDQAKEIIDANGFMGQFSRYCIRYSSYLRIYPRDRDLARDYAAKGVQLGKEHQVIRSIADGNLLMGILTDDFEESIQYTQRSSDLFFELGDYKGGMSQQMNIAKRYLQRGTYDKVLEIVNTVDDYANGITNNDKVFYSFKMKIAQIKAEIFENTGDKDKLITSLKNYNEYSELFGFLVNQEHINQLLLENALSQEKEKIEAATRQNRALLFGLLFLSGIIVLLTRLYFLNAKKKGKIEEQTATITQQYSELERVYHYQSTLLSEVHHRIKNNLQLIISLLTLQKARLTDAQDAGMLDTLNHRINSIALIHEQLYNSKEFDKVDVELYINSLLDNFVSLIAERQIVVEHHIKGIQLNLETITPLGLIWSELVSNSLKYNQNREGLKIYLDLVEEESGYRMHYHDNGKGYPNGQFSANKSGMGFTIINSLSRQLSATPHTYNDDGAHFTLAFKEKVISPL